MRERAARPPGCANWATRRKRSRLASSLHGQPTMGCCGLVVDIERGTCAMRFFAGFNRRKPISSSLKILAKYLTLLVFMLLAVWLGLARLIGPTYNCREIEGSIVPARQYLLPWCNWQPLISEEK